MEKRLWKTMLAKLHDDVNIRKFVFKTTTVGLPIKYVVYVYLFQTNPTEQIPPWEANTSADSQEIPRILWNLKVHHRVHAKLATSPYREQD